MDAEESRQKHERLGRALECQHDTTQQLGQLEKTAQAMARDLEALAQVLAGKRKGMVNTDQTQGRLLVYPDGRADPLPVRCPTEQEIVDLLARRAQLQTNLEQAAAILAPYQKER